VRKCKLSHHEKKKTDQYYRETIAAIITPPGDGGLGALRIAGPDASAILNKLFQPAKDQIRPNRPFHLYYGHIVDCDGEIIDEVTVVEMPAGRSYTGQAQAEIFSHGGYYIMRKILAEMVGLGARVAEPGEFTRRAFLAGRIDLARAEAVADIIASKTEYAYGAAKKNLLGRFSEHIDKMRELAVGLLSEIEASVDYPEEHLEPAEQEQLMVTADMLIDMIRELLDSYQAGQIIKEGFKIAIAGRPNAGKSSLFNLLLNKNRAIVAPVPGTTRDYLTEWIDLDGVAVALTDTAGLRVSSGVIEKAGQDSARAIMSDAELVIWIVDAARKRWQKELAGDLKAYSEADRHLILLNKIDKLPGEELSKLKRESKPLAALAISCKIGAGFKRLRKELIDRITRQMPDLTDRLVLTSERHRTKLANALKYLRRGRKGIASGESPELIAFELRRAVNEIDEITGRIYNEEILDRIFERFCIGK